MCNSYLVLLGWSVMLVIHLKWACRLCNEEFALTSFIDGFNDFKIHYREIWIKTQRFVINKIKDIRLFYMQWLSHFTIFYCDEFCYKTHSKRPLSLCQTSAPSPLVNEMLSVPENLERKVVSLSNTWPGFIKLLHILLIKKCEYHLVS